MCATSFFIWFVTILDLFNLRFSFYLITINICLHIMLFITFSPLFLFTGSFFAVNHPSRPQHLPNNDNNNNNNINNDPAAEPYAVTLNPGVPETSPKFDLSTVENDYTTSNYTVSLYFGLPTREAFSSFFLFKKVIYNLFLKGLVTREVSGWRDVLFRIPSSIRKGDEISGYEIRG